MAPIRYLVILLRSAKSITIFTKLNKNTAFKQVFLLFFCQIYIIGLVEQQERTVDVLILIFLRIQMF